MGKSAVSCFKIITCGRDNVNHEDLQASENSGGRRWSFRKRSPRQCVLSTSVISETPVSSNNGSSEQMTTSVISETVIKETLEHTAANFLESPNMNVTENTSLIQGTKVKTELSAQLDPIEPDITSRTDERRSDKCSVVVIQAATRGFLARRGVLRQMSIIKLQAAIRGYLVRKHAVGTLRCIQGIVKMQALVRARRARALAEGSSNGKYNWDPTLLISQSKNNPHDTSSHNSIEKLLWYRFARKLLESALGGQPIKIKCQPSKSGSAWNWLERWMSISSVSNEERQESEPTVEQRERENIVSSEGKKDIVAPSDSHFDSTSLNSSVGESANSEEASENNSNFGSSKSITPSISHCKLQSLEESNSTDDLTGYAPIEIEETYLISNMEENSSQAKEEIGTDCASPDSKKFSTEQPETEAKKLLRKASNPSFIAAQSKFEELTSASTFGKLGISSSHDLVAESSSIKVSSSEIGMIDNSISNFSSVQIGGSECGTKVSVSSTLDSMNRSDAEVNEIEKEQTISIGTDHLEARGKSSILESDESGHSTACELLSSLITVESSELEKNPEANLTDLQIQLQSEATHLVCKSSSAVTPKGHVTVPESQSTPSGQVSLKSKKIRSGKSESTRKSWSLSTIQRSPYHDSGSRSGSFELKGLNIGKRRKSLGSAKADDTDQEPRHRSGGNSVPNYMQATESARAKAIGSGSPRLSYDVLGKDISIKTRRSLSGADGKEVSPRIHRSLTDGSPSPRVTRGGCIRD